MDDDKDDANRKKHGVPFALAQYAFADPHRVILEDAAHSQDVIRIFGVGYWREGKR